uniref:Trehalose 6-phosphate phosphatase n=1 Tax=Salix viminalis TaxID=40686 RepID=A0A6N2KAM7_SALVM
MFKRNFAKLNQAMGFQRSSNRQKEQPGISDVSSNERAPNSCQGAVSDDANYSSWMVEHPSALTSFDQMMKDAKGKKIVVFLDYDGTLSPIVNDPDRAFMSDEMRASVREVAKYFPTAIISGRSRDKVKGFVQLSNIYYAGSHGMDIMAPPRPARSSDGKYHTVSLDRKSNEAVFQPARTIPAFNSKDFERIGRGNYENTRCQGEETTGFVSLSIFDKFEMRGEGEVYYETLSRLWFGLGLWKYDHQ